MESSQYPMVIGVEFLAMKSTETANMPRGVASNDFMDAWDLFTHKHSLNRIPRILNNHNRTIRRDVQLKAKKKS